MLKTIFYISLIIGILDVIFIYYNHSVNKYSTQWMAGFGEFVTGLFVMGILLLWWIIYFSITKDFAWIFVPIILIACIAVPWIFGEIKSSMQETNRQKEKTEWLNTIENFEYFSEKLGIHFQYISPSQFDGEVSVREEDGVIYVDLEEDPKGSGAVKVFEKEDLKASLQEYLTDTYAKDYPECRFVNMDKNKYHPGRHSIYDYEIVVMTNESLPKKDESCPKFGMEYDGRISNKEEFFIMDKKQPNTYAFVSTKKYGVEAYKSTEEDKFPPKWFQTITFK